jgi:hypothetical protein
MVLDGETDGVDFVNSGIGRQPDQDERPLSRPRGHNELALHDGLLNDKPADNTLPIAVVDMGEPAERW